MPETIGMARCFALAPDQKLDTIPGALGELPWKGMAVAPPTLAGLLQASDLGRSWAHDELSRPPGAR